MAHNLNETEARYILAAVANESAGQASRLHRALECLKDCKVERARQAAEQARIENEIRIKALIDAALTEPTPVGQVEKLLEIAEAEIPQ